MVSLNRPSLARRTISSICSWETPGSQVDATSRSGRVTTERSSPSSRTTYSTSTDSFSRRTAFSPLSSLVRVSFRPLASMVMISSFFSTMALPASSTPSSIRRWSRSATSAAFPGISSQANTGSSTITSSSIQSSSCSSSTGTSRFIVTSWIMWANLMRNHIKANCRYSGQERTR